MGTQLQMLLVWVLEDLIPAEEIIKSKELILQYFNKFRWFKPFTIYMLCLIFKSSRMFGICGQQVLQLTQFIDTTLCIITYLA